MTRAALVHRYGGSLAATAIALAASGDAAARPPPHVAFRLEYVRGPGTERCPDEGALRTSMAVRMGYDPVDATAASRLIVRLSRRGTEIHADFSVEDAAGKPAWIDHTYALNLDCRQLVSTLGLMIRIQTDEPVQRNPMPAPPPAAAMTPSPSPTPITGAALTPKAEPRKKEWPVPRLDAGTALTFGMSSAAAVGFTAQVGLRWPLVSVSMEGGTDLSASRDTHGGTLSSSALVASLAPCLHRGAFFGCGLLRVGDVRAQVTKAGKTERASDRFVGAGARAGVEWTFAEPLALRVSGDIVPAIERVAARIDGAEAWGGSRVVFSLGTGIAATF